jgi:hypothetical protein
MQRYIFAVFLLGSALLAGCGGSGEVGSVSRQPLNNIGQVDIAHVHSLYPSGHTASVAFNSSAFKPSPFPTTTIDEPTYYGGPVLQYPRIYLSYWDWTKDPANERPYLLSFMQGLPGSQWLNILTQYYGTAGYIANTSHEFKGSWNDPNPEPSQPDTQLTAAVERVEAHFGYDQNSLYVIAVDVAQSQDECAFHGYITDAQGHNVPYAFLPYESAFGTACGQNAMNPGAAGINDGVSINAGHEIAEAITDPFFTGWETSDGFELADMCKTTVGLQGFTTGQFALQGLWSDTNLKCIFWYPQ